jgi:hypothetical protein
MSHSNEPWRVIRTAGGLCHVGSRERPSIAVFGGYGHDQSQKDARRAIDVVNATAGIDIVQIRKWAKRHRLQAGRRRAALQVSL